MLLTPVLVKLLQFQHFDLVFCCLGVDILSTFDGFEAYMSHTANAGGGGREGLAPRNGRGSSV